MIAASEGFRDIAAGIVDTAGADDGAGVTTTEEYPPSGTQPVTPTAASTVATSVVDGHHGRACRADAMRPGESIFDDPSGRRTVATTDGNGGDFVAPCHILPARVRQRPANGRWWQRIEIDLLEHHPAVPLCSIRP